MIILISVVALAFVLLYFIKRFFITKLQIEYERSLLEGDRQQANKLGNLYYHSISDTSKKAKGIIDIEAKISQDLKSFT